ncbi:hypothetical protein [Dokdonella koreensis]|uniref:Uncharacterized protein n=1 Tax=Dokdonella koreensis DS-123 TaxID=1300342 RepID=A0A160DWK3_9GAMM|nr:hypothetical protein [Dokdonella koreensis]ANB19019.1 Hypothetical protein I596_3027 [Dokdonella koreensis DS-123]
MKTPNHLRPLRLPLAATLAALAAACAQPPPKTEAPPPRPTHDAVAAVRAAGKGDDSVIQVQPLRDPAVDGFLREAETAEAQGRLDAAATAAGRALKLAPEAPEILQYLAEIELAQGHLQAAEEHAMHSYRLGPRLGGLCARNWQVLVETRLQLGDPERRAEAERQVKECRKAPPTRM